MRIAAGEDVRVSSLEACRAAGITYRQLEHWVSSGWVPGAAEASGSGRPRLFTREQIRRLRSLAWASEIKSMALPALADFLEGSLDSCIRAERPAAT